MKFLKKIVVGVVVYWVAFVAVMIVTFWYSGAVPDTLIQYALGGGAVELIITAAIEVIKPITERGTARLIHPDDNDLDLIDFMEDNGDE